MTMRRSQYPLRLLRESEEQSARMRRLDKDPSSLSIFEYIYFSLRAFPAEAKKDIEMAYLSMFLSFFAITGFRHFLLSVVNGK
jgi:hypothetical protein